jgi:hypothetical protein
LHIFGGGERERERENSTSLEFMQTTPKALAQEMTSKQIFNAAFIRKL